MTTHDTEETYTKADIAAFDAALLREAHDIARLANRELADDITDRMTAAMDAQSCTKADAFLAVVSLIAALLAGEHCASCARTHGARMISLACSALENAMNGTRH